MLFASQQDSAPDCHPSKKICLYKVQDKSKYFAEIFRFLLLVPITKSELAALEAGEIDAKTLYEKIGSDLADYDRPAVI